MKCPNCDVPLMMTERKGIEIDFCTQCRGIWLDRGELDKIIAISQQELNAPAAADPIRSKSEFKPAKSDPAKQYNPERDDHREDRSSRHYRDEYRGERDFRHSRDHDRDYKRSRDDKYRYRKSYSKKKSLLHTLFDIID